METHEEKLSELEYKTKELKPKDTEEDGFYICDTPGFSSLDLVNIELEDLKQSFLEFNNYNCKFKDCNHINTFGCQIENNENILKSRYENYTLFLKEINENRSKLFK